MIDGSTFSYFNYEMKAQSAKVMVDPSFGLQYQGKILNLNAFDGQVTIQASTCSHNTLAFPSCSALTGFDDTPQKPEDNYYANIDSSKKKALQLKNLISIRKNAQTVKLLENTFEFNSVVKGLVYIENTYEMSANENFVLVYGNVFNYTATFFETSAIFIRSETNIDMETYEPSPTQMPCLGLSIQTNTF